MSRSDDPRHQIDEYLQRCEEYEKANSELRSIVDCVERVADGLSKQSSRATFAFQGQLADRWPSALTIAEALQAWRNAHERMVAAWRDVPFGKHPGLQEPKALDGINAVGPDERKWRKP